jgi:hypothetical protein
MGIVNRRNAVIGWLVWMVGKRFARRKAREAVPGVEAGSKRPNKAAILSAVAALGGILWLWRRSRSGNGEPGPEG